MIRTGKKFSKPAMSRVINGDTELKTVQVAPEKVRLDHMMVKIFNFPIIVKREEGVWEIFIF